MWIINKKNKILKKHKFIQLKMNKQKTYNNKN